MSELCQLVRVCKLRTSPYHTQTNGQCEFFNRTLLSMLRHSGSGHKVNCWDSIHSIVYAYNCTKNCATIFYLWKEAQLPIEIHFKVSQDIQPFLLTPQYVEN